MIDLHGDLSESTRALRDQGPTEQIELVLVTQGGRAAEVADRGEFSSFGAVRVAAVPPASSAGSAFAAGVRTARAPVVAYCEDHVLPDPGWVQARLDAHAAGATVVGGVLLNANPRTAVSWAAFLAPFGPFAAPVAGGRCADLPWHQCSYRRGALPAGPELDGLLEHEGLLHRELIKDGHALVLEPACSAHHLNISRWRPLLLWAWWAGRAWGGARAAHERWSPARRALHCLLVPHTIARDLRHRLADVNRVIPARRWSVTAPLIATTVAHAAGEAVGIARGPGAGIDVLAEFELNRRAHVRSDETVMRR